MQRQKFVLSIFSLTLLLLLTGCNPKSTEPMVPPVNFVFVKGGRFDNGYADIKISSFFLAKHALSQADYEAVMGINPAFDHGVGSNFPVYYVTWFNAIEYCNRRSLREGLTPCYSYRSYGTDPDVWPGNWDHNTYANLNVFCDWKVNGYRLPTEMEWMFAARGGRQSQNFIYSGSDDLDQVGWYLDNWGAENEAIHSSGAKLPNELGLYDLSGNLWELVWDIHGPTSAVRKQILPEQRAEMAACLAVVAGRMKPNSAQYHIGISAIPPIAPGIWAFACVEGFREGKLLLMTAWNLLW